MKVKHISLFLLLLLLLIGFSSTTEVKAINTGFATSELSDETKNTFLSNFSITPLTEKPEKRQVLCFDVSEQGLIAVGQEGSRAKEVCVYTSEGEYLYGYSFSCSQSFAVEWGEQRLNIYLVRSDVIISLDSDGNILDIKRVQDTIDNNTYRNSLLYSTKRIVGDTTYIIRNDMGILNFWAISYSQIVTIDKSGTECIIYDVNSKQLTSMIVTICLVIIFLTCIVAVITREFIKVRRKS